MIKKLLILVLILSALTGAYFLFKPLVIEIYSILPLQSPQTEKPIKLIFTGDIMLNRGVEYQIQKQGDNDFRFPFLNIAPALENADLVFGNLESQISDKGQNQGSIYSFRADPKAIEGLKFAGFNILGLANNHSFDYGREALQDSINRLIEADISPVGAGNNGSQAFSPTIKTIGETSIAIFAYSQGPDAWQATNDNLGIAIISEKNLERIKDDIALAKKLADIVIVSMHAGNEYETTPTKEQILFAHSFIDAGADLIIGHHSHIIQNSEIYKEKQIFYGLGNFIFDQGFSEETMENEIIEVVIENGEIERITPKTVKINAFFQPELAQ